MGWLGHKIDTLVAVVVGSVGGIGFSQLPAFIHEYLQRLGGHVDEAQRHLGTIREGGGGNLDESARQMAISVAEARVAELRTAYDAIDGASIYAKPFAFASNLDFDIARRAFEKFGPTIPLDAESLVFFAAGLIAGIMVWEMVKLPFSAVRRRRERGVH